MKTNLIFLVILFLMQSCNNMFPTKEMLSATWVNDETVLVLNKDSTFSIKNFPLKLIDKTGFEQQDKIKGNGIWKIQKKSKTWDQLPFEIYLIFKESEGTNIGDLSFLISGNGFLENKPPYNKIFLWKEEEGGERYYLYKKVH